MLTADERAERARAAAYARHATSDTREATAAAREALLRKYAHQVDPDNRLDPAERDRRIRAAMGADLARARLAASRLRQQREGDLIADALLAAGGEQ